MKNVVLLLFAGLIFFSCKKKPGNILPPAKMEKVLTDVIKADVFVTDFVMKDSSKNPEIENIKLQKQIFKKHGTTSEVFYKSYDYYLHHADELTPMLDSISKQVNNPVTPPPIQRKHIEEL